LGQRLQDEAKAELKFPLTSPTVRCPERSKREKAGKRGLSRHCKKKVYRRIAVKGIRSRRRR